MKFFFYFLNKIRGPAADSRDDRCGTEMDDSTRLMDTTTLNDTRSGAPLRRPMNEDEFSLFTDQNESTVRQPAFVYFK